MLKNVLYYFGDSKKQVPGEATPPLTLKFKDIPQLYGPLGVSLSSLCKQGISLEA
jgi:hypothetical protein